MKGILGRDHIPANKFTLTVARLFPSVITFVEVAGLESEIETADMPDNTIVSGGRTLSGEFTAKVMMHDLEAVNTLMRWFGDSQDPVALDYKKEGVMWYESQSGTRAVPVYIRGMFPSKVTFPDSNLDEVTPQMLEVGFKFDEIFHHAQGGVSVGVKIG